MKIHKSPAFTFFLFIFSITTGFAQTELWGLSSAGGDYGLGNIFVTDGSGNNLQVAYSFSTTQNGRRPDNDLCIAPNGKFYGMTAQGGSCGFGVLFEYDLSTNAYSKILDFNITNGVFPNCHFVVAPNGKLYAAIAGGDAAWDGVLFELDPATNAVTIKVMFDAGLDGSGPAGSLMLGTNGNLYGVTRSGGFSGAGTIFEYNPATNVFTKLYDFTGDPLDGEDIQGGLCQAANGMLYGLTSGGGIYSDGVLYEFNLTGNVFTKKIDLESVSTGRYPYGSLMLATNNKLYGMTNEGGNFVEGTLFEYEPATNGMVKLVDFNSSSSGSNPWYGTLVQTPSGKLYGMASGGGTNYGGVIFEYDPATLLFTKKIDLDGVNESYPEGSLILASNGKLYGMTNGGGVGGTYWGGYGVIFEYDPVLNSVAKKIDLDSSTAGSVPVGHLVMASTGKFYGMTHEGGLYDKGVLYEFNPATNIYTKKIDFDGVNGSLPNASLVEASNGNFYGMTGSGGVNDNGVLFEYNPSTNIYTKKIDFDGTNHGSYPNGSLIQAFNSKLYGMTSSGGTNNVGVLFEYIIASNTFNKKVDFSAVAIGSEPAGRLLQASDSILYGVTSAGGSSANGILFSYNISLNSFSVKVNFDGTNKGSYPLGNLIQAANGKLYGTTYFGGVNNDGVFFEYNRGTNAFTKIYDAPPITGGPNLKYGALMQASNGKLYGMSYAGGTNNRGTLFEFNLTGNSISTKINFGCNPGVYPDDCQLQEINRTVWPGDCNSDFMVDNLDFLYLGVAYNDAGPVRPGASLNWTGQQAPAWTNSFPSGINHNNADCNGDGVVNANDSAAIYQNYGLSRFPSVQQEILPPPINDFALVSNHPIIAPGDTVIFQVQLADAGNPVDSLYGIAYSILFDQALVDTTQINFVRSASFLGTLNVNVKEFERNFYSSGNMDEALYRFNHSNVTNVQGLIGSVSFVASNSISSVVTLHANPSKVRGITAAGFPITFNITGDSVIIDPSFVGIRNIQGDEKLSIFPNPANSKLTFQSGSIIDRIEIFDLSGRTVYSGIPKSDKAEIDVSQLETGIYPVSIIAGQNIIHKKIQVLH